MDMLLCVNCNKTTGFKRTLGFGTFFMVVLTFGFWLLALPFYPKRCICCGLEKRHIAKWYQTWMAPVCILGFALFLGIAFTVKDHYANVAKQDVEPQQTLTRAPTVPQQPTTPVPIQISTSSKTEDAAFQQPIAVEGMKLRKEYEEKYDIASAQYRDHQIVITGNVSGIFVPSEDDLLRANRTRSQVAPILMIDSPPFSYASTVQDALFYPGIMAHSKTGSFFDIHSHDRVPQINQDITLLCTVGEATHISSLTGTVNPIYGDVQIGLYDCVAQKAAPIERSEPIDMATSAR